MTSEHRVAMPIKPGGYSGHGELDYDYYYAERLARSYSDEGENI